MKSLALLTGTTLIGFASLVANAAEPAGEPEPRKQRNPFPMQIADAEARAAARFAQVDTNGDGKVTAEEFSAASWEGPGMKGSGPGGMRRPGGHDGGRRGPDGMGPGTDDATRSAHRAAFQTNMAELDPEIFKGLDADADGKLSPEEFSMEKVHAARQMAMRKATFGRLDRNADGTLTADELSDTASRLRAMDANSDGTVTRDEARAYRSANPAAAG